ncbi:MAG TPA: Bax inhibitor-1 family protein [Chlamydiales bacterium]|nr:Bax inhibitor-1 family protein [Chlamydiales bacterium]
MATAGILPNQINHVATTLNPNPADVPIETVNQRVGEVYAYAALGLAISAISAAVFAKIGFTAVVVSAVMSCPILGCLTLLAIGVGLIAATLLVPKEKSLLKHGCHGLFTVFQGLVLSPLVLINPIAFAAATAGAVALTGGLGALAMKLKTSFERYEKILMVGLGAIALASIGSLFLPGAAGLIAHKISFFGGFALFGALVIHDTHKARREAQLPEFDPLKHSMAIYLDAVNLLVRLWEIFAKK